MALKKLDVYIIKKFLGTYFFSILLIICIAVIFDFSEKIDDFLQKSAPLKAIIFDYYENFIPHFANLFCYLFTFISVIFFTSKMAARSEIIAILSSGVSFRRLMFPYFISALIIASFSFILGNYIIPPANKVRLDFEEKYIRVSYHNMDKNIHRQIKPGEFIYMESYSASADIGYKFSIEKFEGSKLKYKLLSDYAQWDSLTKKWIIRGAVIRTIEGMNEKITKLDRFDTTLAMKPQDFRTRQNVVETMNFPRLNEFIAEQQARGVESIEYYYIEKYRRIASPFAVFILTLIGVSLSVRKTRGGIGGHIGVGIFLSFALILFMQVSHQFAISGSLSPLLAVWLPNLCFLVIGLLLYKLAPK